MSDIYSLFVALILGVVEGLTEFLPVSSTGHMILVGHLLSFRGNTANTFVVVIQFGAILAGLIIFRHSLFSLIGIHSGAPSGAPFHYTRSEHIGLAQNRLTLSHILLGTAPAMILGLIFHYKIKSLFNPIHVMYALVLGGVLLIIAELLKPKIPRVGTLNNLTYCQAFLVGCFQCLALWPGFSRSGVTISGGMLVGISRNVASEFSFLLALPIMLGSSILELSSSISFLVITDISIFIVGFITAFIVAFISIKVFLRLIRNISFIPFAIYRFIVAAVIYIVFI